MEGRVLEPVTICQYLMLITVLQVLFTLHRYVGQHIRVRQVMLQFRPLRIIAFPV